MPHLINSFLSTGNCLKVPGLSVRVGDMMRRLGSARAIIAGFLQLFTAFARMVQLLLHPSHHAVNGPSAITRAAFVVRDSAIFLLGHCKELRRPNFTCFLDFGRSADWLGPMVWLSTRMGELAHKARKLVCKSFVCAYITR